MKSCYSKFLNLYYPFPRPDPSTLIVWLEKKNSCVINDGYKEACLIGECCVIDSRVQMDSPFGHESV